LYYLKKLEPQSSLNCALDGNLSDMSAMSKWAYYAMFCQHQANLFSNKADFRRGIRIANDRGQSLFSWYFKPLSCENFWLIFSLSVCCITLR